MSTTAVGLQRFGTPGGQVDPYGRALAAWAGQGMTCGRAGDYLVAVLPAAPSGRYEPDGAGLVWRAAAPDVTVRVDVAVGDAEDGRFVPGLTVYLAVERGGRTYAAQRCVFRWHPTMHRYAADLRLPAGRYDLTVRIAAPDFARDDRTAGRRYAESVVVRFPAVEVTPQGGADTSPAAVAAVDGE